MNEIMQELLYRTRKSSYEQAAFSLKDIRRNYKELELKLSIKSLLETINSQPNYTAIHDDYNKQIQIFWDRKTAI